MANVVIHKIENLTKLEALLGSAIIGIVTMIAAQLNAGLTVDFMAFYILVVMCTLIVLFQLLYYLKFIIEKLMFLREQKQQAENQLLKLDREITKLQLECALKGVNVSDVTQV